jgi:hypothetical protein
MELKAELISADKAPELLERILKIRDPHLWATRKESHARARTKARKQGKEAPAYPPSWAPSKSADYQYNPLERLGLTAINRTLNQARVALYQEEMVAGRWRFSPDPIVITEDGYLINGQHRLAAATQVVWEEGDLIPQFLVVWGVDKKTALLIDEAQRSASDRRRIAINYADVLENAA